MPFRFYTCGFQSNYEHFPCQPTDDELEMQNPEIDNDNRFRPKCLHVRSLRIHNHRGLAVIFSYHQVSVLNKHIRGDMKI